MPRKRKKTVFWKKKKTRLISKATINVVPVVIPQFQPIRPSRQNFSELLSIIGVHANVKRVSEANMMKKVEVYGWLGAGNIQSVFKYCDEFESNDDVFRLSKYPHGEISAAVINIISEFPEALEFSASDAHKQSVVDKENLFFEAAFAQNFIFAKEGPSRDVVSEQSILYSDEPKNLFCFARRDDRVILFTQTECLDATRYFIQKIWQLIDGEIFVDFQPLLCDENFENSSGRLFAILPDRKLKFAAELAELQRKYAAKFGNYEADKSLSTADWDEISTLNASISEAESFELVVDEESRKEDMSSTNVADLSRVLSEERFVLFQEIKDKEKELKAEQEKFKYSLIPQENIEEARVRFHERLTKKNENATTSTTGKESSMVLRDSNKANT